MFAINCINQGLHFNLIIFLHCYATIKVLDLMSNWL